MNYRLITSKKLDQNIIKLNDFYKTRKDRGNVPSAYSYECKRCSIKRVSEGRRKKEKVDIYPDW